MAKNKMKGYAYANDNANAKPKRAESPKLYSPIRKGWGSSLQIINLTLAHSPKGCAVVLRLR